ncbi:MAG: hypothetical protein ABSG68_23825, partial [Thermoguttaceae bacterium]
MTEESRNARVIDVRQPIGRQSPPPPTRPLKPSDFPGVPAVYLHLAGKLSSPLLMGPPLCEELIALVRHVFSEEEAAVVRRIGKLTGRTAAEIARAENRPPELVQSLLDHVANVKRAIASSGAEGKKKYHLMPIMPGMFEMMLIAQSPESMSPWHRRFAELFEALYETGYFSEYQRGQKRPTPLVRVLSLNSLIDAHPMALPSDRLGVVLDRFDVFGIGQCQCRMTAAVAGKGCGKPLGNCAVMGQWAIRGIEQG